MEKGILIPSADHSCQVNTSRQVRILPNCWVLVQAVDCCYTVVKIICCVCFGVLAFSLDQSDIDFHHALANLVGVIHIYQELWSEVSDMLFD